MKNRLPAEKETEFHTQLEMMRNRARTWVKAHSSANAQIKWVYLHADAITHTATSALKNGLILPNKSGLEMIGYVIQPWKGTDREPTLLMVKKAIEAVSRRGMV